MPPFGRPDAEDYFIRVIQEVAEDERILVAAFLEGKLVGTVQVLTAMLPDQPHRAEVNKLLVFRSARRKGLATALLQRAEDCAREEGKTLLVLGTVAGGAAESLYEKLGWIKAGVIPKYGLSPDGHWCDSVTFWKSLA